MGHPTQWELSTRGRPLQKIQADKGVWTWTRDSTTTYVTQVTDPLYKITTYERKYPNPNIVDFFVTKETYPNLDFKSYDYANVSSISDPVLRHRMTTLIDENNNTTRYQYDNKGRLLVETDALGKKTTYTYHSGGKDGLLQSVTNRRNFVTFYDYDASRRVTTTTEAQLTSVERTTAQSYDTSLGNVLSITTGIATNNPHTSTKTVSVR